MKKIIVFSPPYGDGIWYGMRAEDVRKFSPPCGDCICAVKAVNTTTLFSPPYGDGTPMTSRSTS